MLLGAAALGGLSHLGVTSLRAAQNLVFTAWGGETQALQAKHWLDPFAKKSGVAVLQDTPTDYGKLKAMVEAGDVTWDVVDVEADFALQAAKDGLLEPLDFSVIDKKRIDPRFLSDYAIGAYYFAFVMGFNKERTGATIPAGWSDMFDLEKIPGKRTLYKWSSPGVLEMALIADGVPKSELYPLDLDRAFKKLDTIKSETIWWTSGAQSQQLIASGEATLGSFWNGRLFQLIESGENVGISWDQNLTSADFLVVPKGTRNKAAAMELIAYATSAQAQADFGNVSGYAPINLDAESLMDPTATKALPNNNAEGSIDLNLQYWAENRDEIGTRWYKWQAG
jgi:putative spermidine/putrescine transport system substrate-binding protein